MMTDQEWVNEFNEDIEQLLSSGFAKHRELPESYQKLLVLAQTLVSTDTRSKSQIEGLLRNRLLNREYGKMEHTQTTKSGAALFDTLQNRSSRIKRSYAIGLSVMALFMVLTLTITPLRVFAQDVIHRVGNFIFFDGPTSAEQYVATMQSGTPTPTLDPNWECTERPEPQIAGLLTVQDVSSKAGFSVYEVGYIPDGYTLSSRDVLQTSQSTTVDTSFRMELVPPLQDGKQMAGIIAIDQTLTKEDAQPWVMQIGDSSIVDVTVRGQDGIWLEQIPIYPFQNEQNEWEYARWNQLIWSENGFNFVLQTNMPTDLLPLAELLKIAESLIP
jgi:hypothetical protein